jgi:hypothetical protein
MGHRALGPTTKDRFNYQVEENSAEQVTEYLL